MKIVYSSGESREQMTEVEPGLLVVACDPRNLVGILDYTEKELTLLNELENFTFYTTCLKVYPKAEQNRVIILDPALIESMSGLVHGYRNETAKQWGLDKANSVLANHGTNIITTYQIAKTNSQPDDQFFQTQRDCKVNCVKS